MLSKDRPLSNRTVGVFLMLLPAIIILLIAIPSVAIPQERLPHYFPEGVSQSTDSIEQMKYYLQYLNATSAYLSDSGIPRIFDGCVEEEMEIHGRKIKFVFEPWKKVGDDKYLFYSFGGQQIITREQMQAVKKDFIGAYKEAAEEDYQDFRNLEDKAIKIKSLYTGMSETDLRSILNKPVPEVLEKIDFRDLNLLPPKIEREDFIIREIHLGYGPFLGAVWLNSGVGYITLQGRILEYLMTKNLITRHELIHANPKLQWYPLSMGMDFELMASLPVMLVPEDKIHLIFHGYLRDIREMSRAFFGLDFDRIRKEIILFDHAGNLRIDRDKWKYYSEKVDRVKKELVPFFRDKGLPFFYHDPLFFTALHEKLVDPKAAFRIAMAFSYDLTNLGGHEQTMSWLKSREDEIERIANEVFEKAGEPDSGNKKKLSVTLLRQLAAMTGLSEEEALALAKKYKIKEEDVADKNLAEILSIVSKLIEKERNNQSEVIWR
ncbi:MAG: hypothetical protein Q8R29_02210 [bacterium]|nr:hypothetical protein [bacterium]